MDPESLAKIGKNERNNMESITKKENINLYETVEKIGYDFQENESEWKKREEWKCEAGRTG